LFTNVILKVFTFVTLKKIEMSLASKYERHREVNLSGLWIHYSQIALLIEKLNNKLYSSSIAGYSENEVPIHRIEVGNGAIKLLFWSQMHGDESTATKSLFDIISFIDQEHDTNPHIIELLKNCTLVFIPVLNPDGAMAYTRENFQGIDLNRDAQALESKEAALLHRLVTEEQPAYAFNLHDQTSWYNVANTDAVATMSFLSPAADAAKTLTASRKQAMRVIVSMWKSLEEYLPNQIGRYNDAFCETCFGDRIQKLGFPTILVESGYFPGDEKREKTRKFHFIGLMSALFDIANDKLPEYDAYENIPMNEKNYYDTRFDNVKYNDVLTSIAARYIYKVQNGKLVRVIDSTETIVGEKLKNKLFHNIIDAKGKELDDVIL